jgi:hypothetical protein
MKIPLLKFKFILLFYFVLTSINVSSQETIVYGLNDSKGILFSGNYLYIAEESDNKIVKININETNPQIVDVVTGLNGPKKLALNGDYLYISESIGGKISKIDITQTNPSIENVLTGLNNPVGLAFKRDYLYFSESESDKISRINITQSTPSIEVILTQESHPNSLNNPYDLLIVDNILYINNFDERTDHYHQITINEDESLQVSSGISFPFYTLNLAYNNIDNSIYFFWPPYDAISRIDLNNPTGDSGNGSTYTIIEEHVVWGYPVYGMAFKDGDLYVSKGETIVKYSSSTILSTHTDFSKSSIKVYPNPSNDYISISGLVKEENYKIFDILGKELANGKINDQEKINIQNLTNGLYHLQFKYGNNFRFIKN